MVIDNIFEQSDFTLEKNLIKKFCGTIDELPDEGLPNGRFILQYKKVDFECFFFNKQSKRLYVILNGSRPVGTSPVFKRWSWYTFMDGSVLNIDDPMYQDFPELTLGWYWGNDKHSYRHYVVEIVKKFADKFNFTEIVFYGSSGGGTAAIHCAILYEGSISVVINPQLKVSLYERAFEFQEITGVNLLENDVYNREDLLSQIPQSKSKFIFIENISSYTDEKQTKYLLESFPLPSNNNCKIGLNQLSNNLFLWIYEAEGLRAHDNQEWKTMFRAIEDLTKIIVKDEYSNDVEHWYSILSEFWKERYELIIKKNRKVRALSTSLICVDNSKRIFYEPEMILEAKNDVYNHLTIPFELKSCTGYFIRIDDAITNKKDLKNIFAIKDLKYNEILFMEKMSGEYNLLLITGEDASKIELRIYPNQLGCSNNIAMVARGIAIYYI